jgi:hypothetical protein
MKTEATAVAMMGSLMMMKRRKRSGWMMKMKTAASTMQLKVRICHAASAAAPAHDRDPTRSFRQATITFLKKTSTFSLAGLEKAVRQETCMAPRGNLRQLETLTVSGVMVMAFVVVIIITIITTTTTTTSIIIVIMNRDGDNDCEMRLL